MSKIAIIGAGMAGLSAARVLVDAGHEVRVFDKGRGPGGRMSTRRVQTQMGEISFDHGAQYFTARNPSFVRVIDDLLAHGFVAPWDGVLVRLASDGTNQPLAKEPLYVGVPGMNGVVRALAAGLDVAWGVRVGALTRRDQVWSLTTDQGDELGLYDQVVCAAPAEQVTQLLGQHTPELAALADQVKSLPCWAGMFAFEAPLAGPFDAMRLTDHPMIDFIAANHSKPKRADFPAYVVHANAAWSQAHLEGDAESIAAALLQSLLSFSDNSPNASFSAAHRWRYAKVEVEHGPGFGFDADLGIGVCGDWLSGPRVESAWLSGYALGQKMTGQSHGSKTSPNKAGV
jgi:renalase